MPISSTQSLLDATAVRNYKKAARFDEVSMNIFVIGDIHGYLESLDALIDFAPLQEAKLMVFLGDYVDKGPDSRGVLDRLMEIRDSRHAIFLRGNHDQMLIDAHRDPTKISHLGDACGSGSTSELLGAKRSPRRVQRGDERAVGIFGSGTAGIFSETPGVHICYTEGFAPISLLQKRTWSVSSGRPSGALSRIVRDG